MTGEQKTGRRDKLEDLSESRGSFSPCQTDQTCWHLEGDGRQRRESRRKMKGREQGVDITQLTDVVHRATR